MTGVQPSDEWTFLRAEEFADDDEVELATAAQASAPEEVAMHEILLDGRAVHDPGRSDVAAGDGDRFEAVAVPFDDEEPEDGSIATDDDVEPDLESILESQHYVLAGDDDEA